jgi:hypothetical protein
LQSASGLSPGPVEREDATIIVELHLGIALPEVIRELVVMVEPPE